MKARTGGLLTAAVSAENNDSGGFGIRAITTDRVGIYGKALRGRTWVGWLREVIWGWVSKRRALGLLFICPQI